MTGRDVVQAIVFAVALTFGASALAKLRDPSAFVEGVDRYRVLPSWSIGPAASLVVALELAIAAAFATGFMLRLAAVGATVLLAGFATAVIVNLRRGSSFPCLCFGARSEDRISKWSLARIGLLAGGVLVVLIDPVYGVSWYGSHGPPVDRVFLVLTLGLGIVAVARWLLAIPALRSLFAAKVSHQ